jgi:hypothetical protein
MLEETYCKCPSCDYDRCHLRYGSQGYFQYTACPCCGYADGDGTAQEIWSVILKAEKKTLLKQKLPVTRRGMYEYEEEMRKDAKQ